jgi:hypothetical protein
MARDLAMHQRLLDWGQMVTVGDGSGYPTMSVLHKEWQPPSQGITPSMKTSAPSSARQTHRAIALWSVRMRNTVSVHYCTSLPVAQQAVYLKCNVRTVYARIEESHRMLRTWLTEQARN